MPAAFTAFHGNWLWQLWHFFPPAFGEGRRIKMAAGGHPISRHEARVCPAEASLVHRNMWQQVNRRSARREKWNSRCRDGKNSELSGARSPFRTRRNADPTVERFCGGLCVWVTHLDIISMMTKNTRETPTWDVQWWHEKGGGGGGVRWNSLALSFTVILERTSEFQTFILHITFLNQKRVSIYNSSCNAKIPIISFGSDVDMLLILLFGKKY